MKLIYSPDDNGWYWERYSDWKVSQVFPDKKAAMRAKRKGKLTWTSNE